MNIEFDYSESQTVPQGNQACMSSKGVLVPDQDIGLILFSKAGCYDVSYLNSLHGRFIVIGRYNLQALYNQEGYSSWAE